MAVPFYNASGTQVTGTGAVTPAWATPAVDDVGILAVQSGAEDVSLSDPQGFDLFFSLKAAGVAGAIGSVGLWLFWNRATSTSMGSPTVADPGDHVIARISQIRGAINTQFPFDLYASDTVDVASTAVAAPAGITLLADTLVAVWAAHAIDSAAAQYSGQVNPDLTSFAERNDMSTTSGNGGGLVICTGNKVAAGAFQATTWSALGTASKQVRLSMGIRSLALPRLAGLDMRGGLQPLRAA